MASSRGERWLRGVAVAALVVVSVLTAVARGQVVAECYRLADCDRQWIGVQRHAKALEIMLLQTLATLPEAREGDGR